MYTLAREGGVCVHTHPPAGQSETQWKFNSTFLKIFDENNCHSFCSIASGRIILLWLHIANVKDINIAYVF